MQLEGEIKRIKNVWFNVLSDDSRKQVRKRQWTPTSQQIKSISNRNTAFLNYRQEAIYA